MSHDTEEWCKEWKKRLLVPKMAWGIWLILTQAVESLKISTLMCHLCRKYIMFEPKKGREVICHSTEDWCKILGRSDLCFEIWREEFGKFWPNTWKSQNLHFNGYIMFELTKYFLDKNMILITSLESVLRLTILKWIFHWKQFKNINMDGSCFIPDVFSRLFRSLLNLLNMTMFSLKRNNKTISYNVKR